MDGASLLISNEIGCSSGRVVPIVERHLRRSSVEFAEHNHRGRNHKSAGRLIDASAAPVRNGRVRRHPRLSGLWVANSFSRGDGELDEVSAMRNPADLGQIGRRRYVSTDEGQRRTSPSCAKSPAQVRFLTIVVYDIAEGTPRESSTQLISTRGTVGTDAHLSKASAQGSAGAPDRLLRPALLRLDQSAAAGRH